MTKRDVLFYVTVVGWIGITGADLFVNVDRVVWAFAAGWVIYGFFDWLLQ
jgi:hypothetical protein